MTTWIQNLDKETVLKELEARQIPAERTSKLDELRRKLREAVKKEIENDQKASSGNSENSEAPTAQTTIMEYTAKLDYRVGTDDFEEFVERIELYFEAKNITEESKQRAIFLTKIDAETYNIVRKVCAPKKPKEIALKDIIEKMQKYVKPKVNQTVLRQRFRERKQKDDETFTQYVASTHISKRLQICK